VELGTPLGSIVAEIFTDRAPVSAGNFLRLVDMGLYAGASFYRVVRPDNGLHTQKLRLVQGGVDPTCRHPPLPPIRHESTRVTGLSHLSGTVSMARWEPGTAASEFFIVMNDCPELDAGGDYDEGYAAFGRIRSGMEIVRALCELRTRSMPTIEYMSDQAIIPVPFTAVRIPCSE
jgi:peptidyl-prolyl cis-trans isomerase A (cyclophilin A)